MIAVYCDFCGKVIKTSLDRMSVEVNSDLTLLGRETNQEYHFHIECGTILRNKVNAFISEKGGAE